MTLAIDKSLIGEEFDSSVSTPVTREEIVEFARAVGECDSRYFSENPIAPPTFCVRFRGSQFFHPKIPRSWLLSGFDAGKDVIFGAPIQVGDVITSKSVLHDLYEKTGRSGTMIFLVARQTLTNQRGQPVAVIDSRFVTRPGGKT